MIKLDRVAPLIVDPLPATPPLCREAASPKQKFISLLLIYAIYGLRKVIYLLKQDVIVNKPAAQAAGADPSQCNFTSRQIPLIQQNCPNF